MTGGRQRAGSGALDETLSASLSPRQWEYLRLRGMGYRLDDVARIMDVSLSTAKNHLQVVHAKLHVTNTVDALRVVGWLRVPEGEA